MNEFLQLTDFDTDEVIFIAPELIKSIRQLPKDEKNGRRTVLSDLEVTQDVYKKGVFLVKEEATEIALKTGLGFIDNGEFLGENFEDFKHRYSTSFFATHRILGA